MFHHNGKRKGFVILLRCSVTSKTVSAHTLLCRVQFTGVSKWKDPQGVDIGLYMQVPFIRRCSRPTRVVQAIALDQVFTHGPVGFAAMGKKDFVVVV